MLVPNLRRECGVLIHRNYQQSSRCSSTSDFRGRLIPWITIEKSSTMTRKVTFIPIIHVITKRSAQKTAPVILPSSAPGSVSKVPYFHQATHPLGHAHQLCAVNLGHAPSTGKKVEILRWKRETKWAGEKCELSKFRTIWVNSMVFGRTIIVHGKYMHIWR